MHTLPLRAFRSAALSLQKPPLVTRPGRYLHASAPARAADDGSPGPRDDGSKPDKENGASENDNRDENLFGDNISTASEEGQTRKKTGNGSLKNRLLRSRKPEELPPLHVPKSFLSKAVSRHGDTNASAAAGRIYEAEARIMMEEALSRPKLAPKMYARIAYLLEATAWTEESLSEALSFLESSPDNELIQKKGDIWIAAAYWIAAILARTAYGSDAVDELHRKGATSSSADLVSALVHGRMLASGATSPLLSQAKQIIDNTMKYSLETSIAGGFDEELIEEIVAFVNTDLLVKAPENLRSTDLRRPVTVINVPDYCGYIVPHEIVRHVASRLEADVLHLRASDIAHVVGSYIGQDVVRLPGAISQLGYKAAENSGRSRVVVPGDEENDEPENIRIPYAIVVRGENPKRENKRFASLVDEFQNGSNRGQNEDLWKDLKVNTALEELIHCASSELSDQRPLIVHIDDFNALSMDSGCGAMIIGKLQKIVDGLWANGRQIALVGSCSTKGAPRPYLNSLKELESTERVVTLHLPTDSENPTKMANLTTFGIKLQYLERRDFIRENDENLVRILSSMVEPAPEAAITTTGEIGLIELDYRDLPSAWWSTVLPLSEVYRIASMIIGRSRGLADVFNIESVKRAIDLIKKLEQLKRKFFEREASRQKEQRRETKDPYDPRRLLPSEEDHEEKLESGLVNAEDIRTTFNDVHAPQETIESVKMLTTLSLIRPEAFSYGVLATDRIPGCLLYGPPGTGKTLLAKAVAKESGANMIEISGASINNKFVGESEKNVRALFQLAKKKEPLVIFIDEADALLGARGRRDLGSRRETINQFLREWDGMDKTKAFIMVATNRPFDLDEAVLRRLPRKILIDLPLEADRAAILRIHLKDEVLDETVSIDDIAKRTPLYSGSDLKNVCVAAAMAAVKEQLELEQQQQQQQEQEKPEGSNASNADSNSDVNGGKRRVLAGRHFDKALREIGASVSEDMATLTAIRKFDEKYGDGGAARRRKRKGIGFGVAPEAVDTREARVRTGR